MQVLQLGIMIHSLVIGLTLAITHGAEFSEFTFVPSTLILTYSPTISNTSDSDNIPPTLRRPQSRNPHRRPPTTTPFQGHNTDQTLTFAITLALTIIRTVFKTPLRIQHKDPRPAPWGQGSYPSLPSPHPALQKNRMAPTHT